MTKQKDYCRPHPVNFKHSSSVAMMSVFSRWIFPAMCPIHGWHVTTLWVNCLLWVRQQCQLSLPSSGISKLVPVVIHGLLGWRPL